MSATPAEIVDQTAVHDAIERLPIAAWRRLQESLKPAAREWQLAQGEAKRAYVQARDELLCQGVDTGPAMVEFCARSDAAWAAYYEARAKALEAVRVQSPQP